MFNLRRLAYYIILFVFTYLIFIYPFEVLNNLLYKEPVFKISSVFFTSVFYTLIIFFFKTSNKSFWLKPLIYEGMGIGFISFWIVNIGLIIDFFTLNSDSLVIGKFCILSIFIIVFFSLINARFIKLKKIEISSNKIKKRIKLIFISDTHLGSNSKKHLEKIYLKIKDLDFDILLIGGDFIDSSNFDLKDLDILKDIRKPILFVSGNHEFYLKDHQKKFRELEEFGFKFLDNKSYIYKNINFIGISDSETTKTQKKIAKNLIQADIFNLVLIHKPSLWNLIDDNVDLMLSGHTHNGQIFPFNFLVKLQFKHIYGVYKRFDSMLYVSSGSGCWGPKMRFGTKNEIVEIFIRKNE